ERMFIPLLTGKAAQLMGNPDLPHTYTYVPDIGRALVMLGANDAAFGQAWHVPSAETLTPRQFVSLIAQEAGVDPKISPLPKWLIPLLGLLMPPLRGFGELLYQFEEPFIVDASKFEKTFGTIATPLPEAVRATVQWYRQHQLPPA
ncbi:MAG TPA: hypothetical protein VHO69_05240, partial [Phototrophicaceae bacterium]|nr:hypothetical protein [Phototrophicaceae bacterium]